MKILISHDGSNAHYFIRLGLARAFDACSHSVTLWDTSSKNVFDIFDEFKPDLLITQSYNIDRAMEKCIRQNPNVRVICKISDWGPLQKEINLKEYPIVVANEKEVKTLERLKKETGQPEFGYIHYHSKYLDCTHGYWVNVGIPVKSLMSAADIFDYTKGEYREKYRSDIALVSGRWPYKGRTLGKWVDRLLYPVGKRNIKIAGSGWGCCQAVGRIDNEEVKHFLASTTIGINVSEPHSQIWNYDVIERPWKLAANKTFCISDYVQSAAEDVFNEDEMVYAKTPEEFEELIDHYIRYPREREPFIERAYERVMKEGTYFSRIKDIFNYLDLKYDAEQIPLMFEKIKEQMKL